jgi:hypothetical protein
MFSLVEDAGIYAIPEHQCIAVKKMLVFLVASADDGCRSSGLAAGDLGNALTVEAVGDVVASDASDERVGHRVTVGCVLILDDCGAQD